MRSAESVVSNAPSAAALIPSGPQPSASESRFTSHSVSEPLVVIDSVLPFRSLVVLIGKSAPTTTERLRGGPAKAATAMTGEPFTANAIDGPLPSANSRLPLASPCCSFASPGSATISTSSPCLAKRPASFPTSRVVKVQALAAALPTCTVSAATAAPPPPASAESANTKQA